jgi:hypothetical protein
MNTKLMFLLLGLVLFQTGKTQTNHYFQNNPVWQINSQCASPYPCIEDETYNYYINGDTAINSMIYKKVFVSGNGYYWTAQMPPNPCPTNTFSYVNVLPDFFLRSAGKQMYIRTWGDTSDVLLYDFDLQIGDSLPITFNNFYQSTYVVGIDSIQTPNGFLKKFMLSGSSWSSYLLEGIGHSKGLIEPMNVPLECGYNLLCYSLNDSAYYPAAGPTCFLFVGQEKEKNILKNSVSPNPSAGHFQINLQEDLNSAELQIISLQGQICYSRQGLSGRKIIIAGESLPNGVYFIKIIQDGRLKYVQKIVMSHE